MKNIKNKDKCFTWKNITEFRSCYYVFLLSLPWHTVLFWLSHCCFSLAPHFLSSVTLGCLSVYYIKGALATLIKSCSFLKLLFIIFVLYFSHFLHFITLRWPFITSCILLTKSSSFPQDSRSLFLLLATWHIRKTSGFSSGSQPWNQEHRSNSLTGHILGSK